MSPLEQHAKEAAKRWLDPVLLTSYEEPKSFFIGQFPSNRSFFQMAPSWLSVNHRFCNFSYSRK